MRIVKIAASIALVCCGVLPAAARTVTVTFSGASSVWSASTTESWLAIAGGSGAAAGTFAVAIQNPDDAIGASTSLSGTITITSSTAPNAPLAIPVSLSVSRPADSLPPFGAFDTPADNAVGLQGSFAVTGWALDLAATDGTGVDTVHVWAYPPTGTAPVILGVAAYGDTRPDVGAMFGETFAGSAYGLTVDMLPPGAYDIVVYPHRAKTNTLEGAQDMHVIVR